MTTSEFATSLLQQVSEVKMTLLQRDAEPEGMTLIATFNMLECHNDDDDLGLKPFCFLELTWYEATPLEKCIIDGKTLLERANEFVQNFTDAGFEVFTSLTVHILDSRGPWAEHSESLGTVAFEGESFVFGDEQKRLVEEKCYR